MTNQPNRRSPHQERYHELVDKKFLLGLTVAEMEELERLGNAIDDENEEFYQPIIEWLRLRINQFKRGGKINDR